MFDRLLPSEPVRPPLDIFAVLQTCPVAKAAWDGAVFAGHTQTAALCRVIVALHERVRTLEAEELVRRQFATAFRDQLDATVHRWPSQLRSDDAKRSAQAEQTGYVTPPEGGESFVPLTGQRVRELERKAFEGGWVFTETVNLNDLNGVYAMPEAEDIVRRIREEAEKAKSQTGLPTRDPLIIPAGWEPFAKQYGLKPGEYVVYQPDDAVQPTVVEAAK